jgi:hypothetical protein
MTTTNNEEVKNVYEEVDQDLADTAKEVQEVLERRGYGILPFLRFTATGILPDAKLAKIKPNDTTTGDATTGAESKGKRPNPRPKKA